MIGFALLAAYVSTIPAANWLIGHVGTTCIQGGPCLVPVWFGILAPSGVVLAGLALVLRDLVQRTMGLRWSIGAIVVGAALSFAIAPPSLAIASGTAFLLSELADLFIYTPLQKRRLVLAVLGSSLVGLAIDSVAFLWLAFGSLNHLAGQIVGKTWAVLIATAVIAITRSAVPTHPSSEGRAHG